MKKILPGLLFGLLLVVLLTLVSSLPLQAQSSNCSPSYPDVCIPPAPPDLNCGEISYYHFRVLQPDPHHFDRDRDGVGCEQQ